MFTGGVPNPAEHGAIWRLTLGNCSSLLVSKVHVIGTMIKWASTTRIVIRIDCWVLGMISCFSFGHWIGSGGEMTMVDDLSSSVSWLLMIDRGKDEGDDTNQYFSAATNVDNDGEIMESQSDDEDGR